MIPENQNLSDTQLRALISLLDDQDPEVNAHVWQQLLAMGHSGVERLEAEWETQQDPEMQRKLEEVIQRIHMKGVAAELLDWRKGGGKDLFEGWYLVSKVQFPDLEFKKYKNEINRLVNKTWLEINNRMDVNQKIKVINHILFKMEGYGPNKSKPQAPHNNFMNYLIDQQQGNVLSLGILYLLICRELDLPVSGVILPGYFILMYKDEKTEFFIDVLNGGRTFNRASLQGYLKRVNIEEKASYFKPTSNIYIILSVLKTLAFDYEQNDRPEKAEEINELLDDIDIQLG